MCLEVVWGDLVEAWGGLGCLRAFWGVSMDPINDIAVQYWC